MRAISLWQPWATAIAVGVKRIETRHWSTPYRGPLVIHAAQQWDRDQREFASIELALGRLPKRIPLGAIVAVAKLVDCRRSEDLEFQVSAVEKIYGNYSAGRFGWILDDVRPLAEPIPYKGHQGFFDVPDEILASIGVPVERRADASQQGLFDS